jgi:peptidoglycan-associated lipoprotein
MNRRTLVLACAGATVVALTGCTASPNTPAPDELGQFASAIIPGTEEDLRGNIGDRVFFDKESAVISAEALVTLQRQARWLMSYPYISVTIEGYCDERGTREFNLALGYRRAYAVREFLIAAGVDGRRISTISFGKERPEVVGSNDAAWAQNRRAVTTVEGPAIARQ